MGRLTKAELISAIDIFSHPQSGDESDIFGAYTTARVAMKELKHYKDLEEAGRLIELPCAVGDTVWMVTDNREFKRRMKDYYLPAEEVPDLHISEHDFSLLCLSSMGKTIFLTKEEAEAKLRDLLEIENVKVFKEKFKELKELEGDHIADVRKMGKE